MIKVSDAPIEPSEALREFTQRMTGAGAIVSFTGLVRETTGNHKVSELFLQAYSPLTQNGISEIVSNARSHWKLDGAVVYHRTGTMKPNEPIVFVATASPHRRQAFEAADFIMDYLKTKAVFWKKETTSSGETWIEPRREDYEDAGRWKTKTETCT